jgi:hypothetical protein
MLFRRENSRRRFSGLIVRPREQLKFVLLLFAGGIGLLTIYFSAFLVVMNKTVLNLVQDSRMPEELGSILNRSISEALIVVLVSGLLFGAALFAGGIVFSHRVFGPEVALIGFIKKLRSGDFSARGHLRAKDEFHSLMAELNGLAEDL